MTESLDSLRQVAKEAIQLESGNFSAFNLYNSCRLCDIRYSSMCIYIVHSHAQSMTTQDFAVEFIIFATDFIWFAIKFATFAV